MVKIGGPGRQAYYDRNMALIVESYAATIGSHTWTTRWTYTVPSGKKAQHNVLYESVAVGIATAGRRAVVDHQISTDGGSTWKRISFLGHDEISGFLTAQTVTATFILEAGHMIRGMTDHDDTINHAMCVASTLVEFDA